MARGGKQIYHSSQSLVKITQLELFNKTCEEIACITSCCNIIGDALKSVASHANFMAALQASVVETQWKNMSDPKSGPTLVACIEDCKIEVQKCANLNHDVVKDDVETIMSYIFDNSSKQNKYQAN